MQEEHASEDTPAESTSLKTSIAPSEYELDEPDELSQGTGESAGRESGEAELEEYLEDGDLIDEVEIEEHQIQAHQKRASAKDQHEAEQIEERAIEEWGEESIMNLMLTVNYQNLQNLVFEEQRSYIPHLSLPINEPVPRPFIEGLPVFRFNQDDWHDQTENESQSQRALSAQSHPHSATDLTYDLKC